MSSHQTEPKRNLTCDFIRTKPKLKKIRCTSYLKQEKFLFQDDSDYSEFLQDAPGFACYNKKIKINSIDYISINETAVACEAAGFVGTGAHDHTRGE